MAREKKVKAPKIKAGKAARREAITGYLFIAPWIIGVLMFLI